MNDDELAAVIGDVVFSDGGVLPHINNYLLPKPSDHQKSKKVAYSNPFTYANTHPTLSIKTSGSSNVEVRIPAQGHPEVILGEPL